MNKQKPITLKSYLLILLFFVSIFFSPNITNVAAQDDDDIDTAEELEGLNQAMGQIFGLFREFGATGETFASVFQLMFANFANMSDTQELDGVYVLNASIEEEPVSGNYTYGDNQEWEYKPWGVYNLDDAVNPEYQDEYPYFVLERNGTVEYVSTEGVSLTFIIWDNDGSFIEALDNLISTVKEFMEIQKEVESNPDSTVVQQEAMERALQAAIRAATYFLIHVNDIITGDEVIIVNPIAYTNYVADFDGSIDAEWYITENGQRTNNITLEEALPTYEEDYREIAQEYNDEYMLYLLNEEYLTQQTQNYTRFSFDIIEIWLKQFQISIDAEAILGAISGNEDAFAGKTATDIFQELKLEFYIFTHHFSNWVLYDDEKFDGKTYNNTQTQIDADAAVGNQVPDVLFEQIDTYENETVERISDTEIIDYILFRGADDWEFIEPQYNLEEKSMEWGIRAENLRFRVLPIGMNDGEVNETVAPIETMDYMELGFKFEPWKNYDVNTDQFTYVNPQGEKTMGAAKVKLLQSFGAWTLDGDDRPFTPHLKSKDLDLATIYMSTIFHFRLEIDNKKIVEGGETPAQALLNESNYQRESDSVKVGDVQQELPLAEIDIAGPEYEQFEESGVQSYPAKTTTIPTIYAEYEGQSSETYTQEDQSIGRLNSTVQFDISVLIYAVSYPTFGYADGYVSGDEIIHDPTFSIFIISENPGFWGVILVLGSVTLVGVAALLITKRKQSSLGFK